MTSTLSVSRSNQLSYEPQTACPIGDFSSQTRLDPTALAISRFGYLLLNSARRIAATKKPPAAGPTVQDRPNRRAWQLARNLIDVANRSRLQKAFLTWKPAWADFGCAGKWENCPCDAGSVLACSRLSTFRSMIGVVRPAGQYPANLTHRQLFGKSMLLTAVVFASQVNVADNGKGGQLSA